MRWLAEPHGGPTRSESRRNICQRLFYRRRGGCQTNSGCPSLAPARGVCAAQGVQRMPSGCKKDRARKGVSGVRPRGVVARALRRTRLAVDCQTANRAMRANVPRPSYQDCRLEIRGTDDSPRVPVDEVPPKSNVVALVSAAATGSDSRETTRLDCGYCSGEEPLP